MDERLFVENQEVLTSIFGQWPSFHDAEVLSIVLDRAGDGGASLDAQAHVFEMTDAVDESGRYVLTKHTRVTLRFTNIDLRNLRWFNHQNSLSGLVIGRCPPDEGEGHRLLVNLGSNYGVEADFFCDRVIVIAAEPFTPDA